MEKTTMQENVLTGKVALITGGARRVGAEMARLLHAHGMNLVIHYRSSSDDAQALQTELEKHRPKSVALAKGDLLKVAQLPGIVEAAAAAFGRLDVLVNNASSFYPTPVGMATEEQWDDLIGTNLRAPFFLAQAAAPHLKKTRGCIVNIADIHADRPIKRYPIYCMAKAGIVMLTRSLARELAPEVRVNAIAPGTILWPEGEAEVSEAQKQEMLTRIPLGRSGSPDDIASTALFLIRDATYINGQVIAVDGGRTVVA
jgi:pteridine reductase